MKFLSKYSELDLQEASHVFEYLMNTMKETIRTYEFYVAWEKVLGNVKSIDIPLNILNSLIGKDDIKNEFKKLIKDYPEVVSILPILIAVRDNTIKIAELEGDIEYCFKKKKKLSDAEIEKIAYFAEQSGLLKIFGDKNIKNLVDYCIGVEVGLDTNARKNRTGTAMENLCEFYVKDICEKNGFKYLTQATVREIKEKFGREVPTDKSDRHFDFVIDTGEKVYVIEVNYYGGGGSKLKAVAGEFKSLYKFIRTKEDVEFIWITDGKGWGTARKPLLEAFDNTDFIFNIKMVKDGLLSEVIKV